MSKYLPWPKGTLFAQDGGDATCRPQTSFKEASQRESNAVSKVQSSDAADICSRKHGGNAESVAAFQSIKERLTVAQERVLNCISEAGTVGRTVDEVAIVLGATPNEISGRASELKRDGKVKKSGTRLTRGGNPAAVLVAL